MFGKALKTYLQGDETSSRYFVRSKGEIRLGKTEFKGQGGEGSVYVKGPNAYKIYGDPARCITQAKIDELAVLVQPNIIRPLELVLDARNRPVGYSMRSTGNSYLLCQLFPKAFRQRNNITPDLMLRLVRQLQTGVSHIHSRGILIVDLNELNFQVASDFSELFFIDVDSYQTSSFPATMLMSSISDPHAKSFSTDSDWFSFAVVSFQMFVGIHPFKGTHPAFQHLPDNTAKLNARMRANVSVLHPGVSVPPACLPFSVIPPNYLDWYRAVFEQGRRLPPPQAARAVLSVVGPTVAYAIASRRFAVSEFREFDSEIIWHDGVITATEQSVYFNGQRYVRPPFDVKLVVTPRKQHLIAAYHDGTQLRFHDLTTNRLIETQIEGEEVMISHGQLYIKQHEHIFAIDFIELPNNTVLGLRSVANVMMNSTRVFDGVAIQNLLGASYASIPSISGGCHQVRLGELDGAQIVNAKLYRNILVVVVTTAGQYDKYVFRFAKDFSTYDVRKLQGVMTSDIEFTVLDTGVVLHLIDDDKLELFSSRKDSAQLSVVEDEALKDDLKLFHTGKQALMAKGRKLYKFKLVP
jgi:serine/threonine protein kinase